MKRPLALAMVFVLASGCSAWDELTRPDIAVQASEFQPDAWNRDGRFRVLTPEPGHAIRIEATSDQGVVEEASGQDDVTLAIPDGTWDISYYVDGHRWDTLRGIRIDGTPPVFTGLQRIGNAEDGAFTLGQGATVDGASSVVIVDQSTGATLGSGLPFTLERLSDGLHAYLITALDEAGNSANATVQVRVGTATELPEGQYDFGVVARFSGTVEIWDLTATYLSPSQARAETANGYLGSGFGIEPDEPAVRAVVADVVTPDMDALEVALALYGYMADELEYDDSRLGGDGLLTPRQVLLDTEDPHGGDADGDGLVDDVGAQGGNGVKGGICRDLAATYVSLLRAAGVPARLVSGYVGGTVNGFHAWVEFYGGAVAGHDAWIPVDVSPIDGPLRESSRLQSFGIRLPDYLALRVVPEAGEIEGWSTAIGVRYSVPSGSQAPEISFEKSVEDVAIDRGVLCFDPATRARHVAARSDDCSAATTFYVSGFVRFAERILDYGIAVSGANPAAQIEGEIAYPTTSSGALDYAFYPASLAITLDPATGKASAEIA